MKNNILMIFSIMIFCLTLTRTTNASYLLFDQTTDTINVSGQLVLEDSLTYEARILFTNTYNGGGYIFNEWTWGQEDKVLFASPNKIGGYSYPIDPSRSLIISNTTLSFGVPHHVAYVYDGSSERLYLDGHLVKSRTNSGDVGDGSGNPHIGAIFRDGYIHNSFIGYLDTIRISNIARYNSTDFDPPTGDLVADEHTLLLYNFNESPDSTTIIDLSGNGHDGVLGVGFDGATSPSFANPVPIPRDFWLLGFGLAIIACTRYRKNILNG